MSKPIKTVTIEKIDGISQFINSRISNWMGKVSAIGIVQIHAHISNHIDGISEAMPNISQSYANNVMNTVNFLKSKISAPKSNLPMDEDWSPSQVQKEKFERYYDAVAKPIEVLDNVKDGSLTSDHMEALQAVHPELLKQMQTKMIGAFDKKKAMGLSPEVKRSLGLFMGTPLDTSMIPAVSLSNQMTFQKLQQQKAAQQQMLGKTTQKGLSELSLGKRAATGLQRDEEE